MASAAKLYTPEVLALATSLAGFPFDAALPLQAQARSKSCGSAITLGLELDGAGRISRIGLKSQACAVGQAASAIFARAALGRDAAGIAAAADGLAAWLRGEGAMPDWPELEVLAAARDFPGRHAAMLLPWNAARDALSTGGMAR